MVQTVNLETFSDADFVRKYVYRTIGGVPINLGTDVLRMMIRSHPADVTAHIDLTSVNGGIEITDAINGAFTLRLPVDTLKTLLPGTYVHSLIKTDSTFTSRRDIWRGTLTHQPGPTRWKTRTLNP
jgi:hypothetical protein